MLAGVFSFADAEKALCCTPLWLLGDCGSGKTTFLRTLAGGAVGILQVLRYHTSHFTNLWFDVSPQTLRTFLAANPFARGRKNDNVAQTPSRLLPLFPTELSTCTLAMDLQELAFFLSDEAFDDPETLDLPPQTVAQHAIIRVMEVGGDLLDNLMKTRCNVSSNGDGETSTSRTKQNVYLAALQHIRACHTTLSYFVNCALTLRSLADFHTFVNRIVFLIAEAFVLPNRDGGTERHLKLFFTRLSERCGECLCDIAAAFNATVPSQTFGLPMFVTSIVDHLLQQKWPALCIKVTCYLADHLNCASDIQVAPNYEKVLKSLHQIMRGNWQFISDTNDDLPARVGQALYALAYRNCWSTISLEAVREALFQHSSDCGGCNSQQGEMLYNALELLPPLVLLDHFEDAASWLVAKGYLQPVAGGCFRLNQCSRERDDAFRKLMFSQLEP